jgi:DNA-binding MarR family transcriptional regulator
VTRDSLTAAVLAELAEHQPTKALRHMRRLPGGALSLVHLTVLTVLDAEGPLAMRRLAEAMDVSQASATGVVDRMEQRGLVERQRDDEDRRVVTVALTEQGRTTLGGFANERREHLVKVLAELTEEELGGFLVGLRGMRRGRELLHARLTAEHDPANPEINVPDDATEPRG